MLGLRKKYLAMTAYVVTAIRMNKEIWDKKTAHEFMPLTDLPNCFKKRCIFSSPGSTAAPRNRRGGIFNQGLRVSLISFRYALPLSTDFTHLSMTGRVEARIFSISSPPTRSIFKPCDSYVFRASAM